VAEQTEQQRGVLPLWFSLEVPVSRRAYWVSGVLLALLKYALDAALVYVTSHKLWSPLAYLSPLYTFRTEVYRDVKWLPFVLAIIALPFLWIGVSMSIRRAADAGLSPWLGTVFLVPIFNYLVEGSTWYELTIEPRAYRRIWTDALIHQIHERVLVHIQRRSEHAR
jgi:uncharacterized membrane protein YhaH (DUF805 family)